MKSGTFDAPHPLATALAEAVRQGGILVLGVGNGRNLPPFRDGGHQVTVADEACERLQAIEKRDQLPGARYVTTRYDELPFADGAFGGVLATHVLQHGTREAVGAAIAETARVLIPGGLAYLVMASPRDERFGKGRRFAADCWAPETGDEAGVVHFYPSRDTITALFSPRFRLLECVETDASTTAGAWAHARPGGLRHWFIKAERLP